MPGGAPGVPDPSTRKLSRSDADPARIRPTLRLDPAHRNARYERHSLRSVRRAGSPFYDTASWHRLLRTRYLMDSIRDGESWLGWAAGSRRDFLDWHDVARCDCGYSSTHVFRCRVWRRGGDTQPPTQGIGASRSNAMERSG